MVFLTFLIIYLIDGSCDLYVAISGSIQVEYNCGPAEVSITHLAVELLGAGVQLEPNNSIGCGFSLVSDAQNDPMSGFLWVLVCVFELALWEADFKELLEVCHVRWKVTHCYLYVEESAITDCSSTEICRNRLCRKKNIFSKLKCRRSQSSQLDTSTDIGCSAEHRQDWSSSDTCWHCRHILGMSCYISSRSLR